MNISGKAVIAGIGELKPMKKAKGSSTLQLLAEAAAE